MYYRRKILLALLEEMGGNLQATDMQKLLFLFCEGQEKKSYEFVPYRFGCFSFQSYADKRTLIKYGFLKETEAWDIAEKGLGHRKSLKKEDLNNLNQTFSKYSELRGNNLIREVYLNYPYYAIHSEVLNKVLSPLEVEHVEAQKPLNNSTTLFTIGYEGITQENYLNKLIRNNIKLLCDVRKNALSMKYGFSKNQLKDACERLGIAYIHIPELGIVSEKRKKLKTPTDYEKLFAEYELTTLKKESESLMKLIHLLKQYERIAITCFEACESDCHRGRVAKAIQYLPGWNYSVKHL